MRKSKAKTTKRKAANKRAVEKKKQLQQTQQENKAVKEVDKTVKEVDKTVKEVDKTVKEVDKAVGDKSKSIEKENNNKEKELTATQKKDLDNIMNDIDKEVNKTVKTIRTTKTPKRHAGLSKIAKKLLQMAVLIALATYLGINAYYISEVDTLNDRYESSSTNSTQSTIYVSMDEESKKLVYDFDKLSIKCDNDEYIELNKINWVKSNIDTESISYSIDGKQCELDRASKLKSLILRKSYAYAEYTNNNGNANKEILFACAKPLDIDLSELEKKSLRFYEKSNPVTVKSYINSFNNSFLMLNENIGGGELSIDTLEDTLYNTESNMKTSSKNEGIVINFKELGALNVNELDGFGEDAQVIYNSDDGVLRITNEDTKKAIYVFNINNEVINCKPEDLVSTNIAKVFIHKKFDDKNSKGYDMFAIVTENNLYCFKADSRETVNSILNSSGLDYSSLKIDKIQEVVEAQY